MEVEDERKLIIQELIEKERKLGEVPKKAQDMREKLIKHSGGAWLFDRACYREEEKLASLYSKEARILKEGRDLILEVDRILGC